MWEPGNIVAIITGLVGLGVSTYVAMRKQKKDDTVSEVEIDEEKAQSIIKKWKEYSKTQEVEHAKQIKRLEDRDNRQQEMIETISRRHNDCEIRCARLEERLNGWLQVMRDAGVPVPPGTDHHRPLLPDGQEDRRVNPAPNPDYHGPRRRREDQDHAD